MIKKYHYIHINKCAGTSIHRWFRNNLIPVWECNSGDHLIIKNYENDVTYITSVRNPYNRIVSHYKQWVINEWTDIKDVNKFIQCFPECYKNNSTETLLKSNTYDFWKNADNSPIGIRMIKPCMYWIKDTGIVKWFKFEELGYLQNYFINQGFTVSNIHEVRVKKTITEGKKSYIDLLDSKSIQIINEYFKEDFEFFNYKMI
tara:strand:+ start:3970 stop:4575 length:606 start_codon:yes stop_codon:yes gene_type:complete